MTFTEQTRSPVAEMIARFVVDLVRVAVEEIEVERGYSLHTGPALLSRKEAAVYLGIGLTTLDELAKAGDIKVVRLGDGKYPKFSKKALDQYIERLQGEEPKSKKRYPSRR